MVNRAGSRARPGRGRTPHPCGELRGHTVRVPRWLSSNFRTLRRSTVSLPSGPTPIFVRVQSTAISRKPNLKTEARSPQASSGSVPIGPTAGFSERVLQGELNLAIRQAGVVYLSHGRRIEIIYRDVEVRVIEQIEKLRTELNFLPLGYGNVFEQRKIQVADARAH